MQKFDTTFLDTVYILFSMCMYILSVWNSGVAFNNDDV